MPYRSGTTGSLFAEDGTGTLRLLVYVALALLLMVADHRGGFLHRLRTTGSLLSEPFYWLAAAPLRLGRELHAGLTSRYRLASESERLERELLIANARLRRLDAVQEENRQLRALLAAPRAGTLGVQLARLIDIDLDPFRHRVLLDIGANQGVRTGLALIDASGVVGQVIEVTPITSVAMLISDPSHAIPVQVARSGVRTIALGTGATDRLELPNIPPSADVQIGDLLVTSGLGGIFPAGFPVGRIESLHPDERRLFIVADARPAAALERSGELLLVRDVAVDVGPPAPTDASSSVSGQNPAAGTAAEANSSIRVSAPRDSQTSHPAEHTHGP